MIFTLKEPTLRDFIRVLINKTVKANKPLSVSIEGESGAGKSVLTILISYYLQEIFNADCDMQYHFIYTPSQFNQSIEHMFYTNDCNFPALFVQETVSFAPSWFSPLSKKNPGIKIYQILNLSREVRPIAFFICEQQFTDLYSKLRRRMNFFFKIVRYVTSEGVSLQPVVKPFLRDELLTEKIVFVEPIIYVNGKRVRNPVFVMPKLTEEQLKQFKTYDKQFKEEYIRAILSQQEDKAPEAKKPVEKTGIWVTCKKCNYTWQYTGKRKLNSVICPMCRHTGVREAQDNEIKAAVNDF